MKALIFALTFLSVFLALNARAQFVEGVYNRMMVPMDATENSHTTYYANTPFPGDTEDSKNQELRYKELTTAVDHSANRHIYILSNEDKNFEKDMTDDMLGD